MADITVQNLTKYYGDRLILKDISFDIQPGEKVAILGANGAGKTTLLNILTGRLPYDGGHVGFGQGRTAGVIDQMPDFPPECTVEDILRLAFKESDEVAAAMDELLGLRRCERLGSIWTESVSQPVKYGQHTDFEAVLRRRFARRHNGMQQRPCR